MPPPVQLLPQPLLGRQPLPKRVLVRPFEAREGALGERDHLLHPIGLILQPQERAVTVAADISVIMSVSISIRTNKVSTKKQKQQKRPASSVCSATKLACTGMIYGPDLTTEYMFTIIHAFAFCLCVTHLVAQLCVHLQDCFVLLRRAEHMATASSTSASGDGAGGRDVPPVLGAPSPLCRSLGLGKECYSCINEHTHLKTGEKTWCTWYSSTYRHGVPGTRCIEHTQRRALRTRARKRGKY